MSVTRDMHPNLRLEGLGSSNSQPMSQAHQDQHHQDSEETDDLPDSPQSSRSSYYVPTPDRDTFLGSLEDEAETSPSTKRKSSFLRKLWPARRSSYTPMQHQKQTETEKHDKTDRLERFVKFRNARAAEEAMLKERSLADTGAWLIL